jgi:hypothetical protein
MNTPTTDDVFLSEHADAIRAIGKRVVTDILEVGRRLVECKRIAGHGGWLPWLEREFGWKEQTARNYMLAYEWAARSPTVGDLNVDMRSLYLLAAPSTPEPARAEVIERAEAGERLTHEQVKQIVDGARDMAKQRKSLPPGTTIPSEEMMAEAGQRHANFKGWARGQSLTRNPGLVAYEQWLKEVKRVTGEVERIAKGPPTEVVQYLRSAPERAPHEAKARLRRRRESAMATISKLSERIDWLRAQIADLGRRPAPPAKPKAPSAPPDPEAKGAAPGTVH